MINSRDHPLSPGSRFPCQSPTSLVAGQPQDAIERIASSIPIGRMGEPEEVAKAALLLASDDSSFVPGIELSGILAARPASASGSAYGTNRRTVTDDRRR